MVGGGQCRNLHRWQQQRYRRDRQPSLTLRLTLHLLYPSFDHALRRYSAIPLRLEAVKPSGVVGENFLLCRVRDIGARFDAGNILEILRPLTLVGIVGSEKNVILAEQL